MEEISSLDSFRTEPETGGDAAETLTTESRPESEASKLNTEDSSQTPDVNKDATNASEPVAEECPSEDRVVENKEQCDQKSSEVIPVAEELEEISEDTLDENSAATSVDPVNADENTHDKPIDKVEEQHSIGPTTETKTALEPYPEELPITGKEESTVRTTFLSEDTEKPTESDCAENTKNTESTVDVSENQESADFEQVDAHVSSNAAGTEESDMLGESDMTLPTNTVTAEDTDKDASATVMEVDNEDDVVENEGKDISEKATPTDVEMQSLSNSPECNKDINTKGNDKNEHQSDDAMEIGDEVSRDNSLIDSQGKDVVDNEESEPIPTEVDKVAINDLDLSNESNDNSTINKNAQSETTEKTNLEAEDVMDPEGNDDAEISNEDPEVNNELVEISGTEIHEEEEPEQEDEPVENVQEPEESDVCLIPDDTETQMTEAEKEQAILARENAEKEGELEEKQAETAKEQSQEEVAEDTDADAEAQATEAGAEATAMEGNEDATPSAEALDAGDEPLLEEMQSGPTGESSSTSKIIIAWIVATTNTCSQCGEEKLCGFRYKNLDTSDVEYLCDQNCCDALIEANEGKYFIRRKKFLVEELSNESSSNSGDEPTLMSTEDDEVTECSNDDRDGNEKTKSSEQNIHNCLQCKEDKHCKYFFKQEEETFYICNDDCFNLLSAEQPEKFKLKRHSIRVRNIGATTIISTESTPLTKKSQQTDSRVVARTAAEAEAARLERVSSFTRRCAECFSEVTLGDKNLLWETMDFCNEICLGKYQRTIGANCQTCQGEVPPQALGKYCVRFGFDIRQFCCAACLNEFKKGLKTCSCCQKDISSGNEGFLAPVGDKEQFKDFCTQACMRRYDAMCNPKKKIRNDVCAVCNNDKPVRVEIMIDEKEHNFCSNPCFSAFKFVSNIVADQCGMCCKYFERKGSESFTIYTERRAKVFCSRICLNVYIIVNRKIVSCQWCKVKKYNFDMIYKQQDAQEILMCSLNCLTLYGVSINAFSRTVANCDNCNTSSTPQYHLTMSDASMRNFCTYQCVMQFQSQFARTPLTLDSSDTTGQSQQPSGSTGKNSAPFPTGLPKRVKLKSSQQSLQIKLPTKNNTAIKKGPQVPVISAVSSLASGETETMIGNVTVRRGRGRGRKIDSPPPLPTAAAAPSGRGRPRRNVDYTRSPSPVSLSPPRSLSVKRSSNISSVPSAQISNPVQMQEKSSSHTETKIVTVPPYPPAVRNVQTSCKPQTVTVGFQCEPTTKTIATQTSKDYSNKILIPVPVPIYIPQPMYMYSAPFPVPVPIPLPIPVPIFIPTTRNSAQGILKEIKKIQDKMPADPFEAELLMMAEMVAEEKRDSDSDSEDEIKPDPGIVSMQYDNNVQQVEVANNSYGEDVLQMALKMATADYDQPTVDLETAMTANTITNPPPGMVGHEDSLGHMGSHHMQPHHMMDAQRGGRGRKRGAVATPVSPRGNRSPVKRQRLQDMDTSPQPPSQALQPIEKPDANMCLKYTFGVNAWKQWVMTKNADLEKSSIRRRPFKTELLQMTADELNYSLCLFVKEVRKPNGTEYAPDTIYYLVLGIQQYLYENGRIDNIFTDPYYERFTDCLDEVARKFSVLYNDSQYIVTRVEEEHLWECKQLGAHSPHVLLSTLMFFNTKHFNLTTVEEHMQLSFSHIMKHWKRSAQNAKSPGTRNVLLRFYPPQAGLDANPRKKKVYEQQENEENPLRCPVRLYEFYLSKCPESVKTRNDVFYLQPERSCVPDSPVWYSTQALSQESLQKMLHRVKMVKEINIALLTS